MSSDFKSLSCVRCKSYLFEEDDVVFCPVCGAPHHRECYNALGHCAMEELHGTENEYSKQKTENTSESKESCEEDTNSSNGTVKCQMCGEEYSENSGRCSKCGAPNMSHIRGFAQFDFLGGVPKDYDLGEGVTADEAKQFVVSNTHRYIPKFAALNKKNKVSWNWLAFISPTGWLLSRKMYKSGAVAVILTVMSTFLYYPLLSAINSQGTVESTATTATTIWETLDLLNGVQPILLFLAILSIALSMGVRIFTALFGDYWYKNNVISKIKAIKELDSADREEAFRKKGGASLLLLMLGIFIPNFVANFIIPFLG